VAIVVKDNGNLWRRRKKERREILCRERERKREETQKRDTYRKG
jgi:hypothetical protein